MRLGLSVEIIRIILSEWCPASPDDRMGGSGSNVVMLVHNRFRSEGRPHPTRANARPTFPLGEGSAYAVQTWYYVPFIDHPKSLPRGGRWPRSGRMRATYRKHSVVYSVEHHPSVPPIKSAAYGGHHHRNASASPSFWHCSSRSSVRALTFSRSPPRPAISRVSASSPRSMAPIQRAALFRLWTSML